MSRSAGRLYELAAPRSPLWRVDLARTLFVGPLDYNASHQHGAPVFLSSLDAPFGLRVEGGPWMSCEAAMIPAGRLHELHIGGEPIAVLYVEPSASGADAFLPLLRNSVERCGVVTGASACKALMRNLFEDDRAVLWAGEALDDLIGFGDRRASRAIDSRVAAVAEALGSLDEPRSLAGLARVANLSGSRLRHLFTAEVGVSMRRYRAWTRMRRAIGAVANGANLTTAAHEAGFSDQAHFANDFRRTFGAPASRSLKGVRPSPL